MSYDNLSFRRIACPCRRSLLIVWLSILIICVILNQLVSIHLNAKYFNLLFDGKSNEKTGFVWPRPEKIAVVAITAPPYMTDVLSIRYSRIFHFYLPITIAAWRRLGYATFVIIIGSPKPWFLKNHYLNYVYETIEQKLPGSAKFLFIETNSTDKISRVKTAQVIRLFASYLEPVRNLTDSYMVTADADTLPLNDIYSLPNSSYTIRISIPKRRTFSPLGSNLTLGTFLT